MAFVSPDGSLGVVGHNDTDQAQIVRIETTAGDRTTITVGPREMFSIRR